MMIFSCHELMSLIIDHSISPLAPLAIALWRRSQYPFGAAHSSTSVSAGLGMAVARDLQKKNNHVVCVIGDGAMSAGMAYEAMNNAGSMNAKLIVILKIRN